MSNFDYDALRLNAQAGDRLSTERWNALVDELQRTNGTLNRIHLSDDELPLVGIGTGTPQAKLQIIHKNQNADGNALILGPRTASNLRLGYHQNYSWVQSHGGKPLAINPRGNNVGIRTLTPTSPLHVHGMIQSSRDGYKFPNGSVQQEAVLQTVVRSGSVTMNRTGSYRTSPLLDGRGRSYTSPEVSVKGFSRKPQVIFSISHLDSYRGKNTRIKTQITGLKIIGPTGNKTTKFRVKFSTWSDSTVYQCVVRWMAIGV